MRALQAAGLLRVERFRRGSRIVEAASPTASGRRLLLRAIDPRAPGDTAVQGYRAGPARASQVLHDTAVHRAAQIEIDALERRGCRVLRVVLDDDLQAGAWCLMDRARRGGMEPETARAAAAVALGLEVRAGKLLFPDVRIECEEPRADGGGSSSAVDVEVTTAAYRGPALRAKAAAGFRLYALGADGSLRGPEPGLEVAR